MDRYSNGKIYKIINTVDDNVYIGSTTSAIYRRMANHRGKSRNLKKTSVFYEHMRKIGVEHFKIVLIKLFPCNSKDELEAEEFNEMSKYEKSKLLNDNIVYKKHSENHSKKVGEAQLGDKHHNWQFGSIFERHYISSDGYNMAAWCFAYTINKKQKRVQFSIKKYGYEKAKEKAIEYQKQMFPNMI